MRIIIDINHPAHVHYFKNAIHQLKLNGHELLIVAREREFVQDLLDSFNIPYINRGKGRNSVLGKILYMLVADIKYISIGLKFKPDLLLSFSTPYIAHLSKILNIPHIALNDTEHTDQIHSKLTYPFCSSIITPSSFQNDLGKKHVRFNGLIEGLYLHKNYYKPNKNIRDLLKLKDDEEYVILRFVSWNAHHDVGQKGFDNQTKLELIKLLNNHFRIFISSEDELPEEFVEFKINIPPERMHDALAYASIFIGESATMASESALLGTFAVFINSLPLMCNIKLGQEAGIIEHFRSPKGILQFVKELIGKPKLKENANQNSSKMQENFIDSTKFLVWFIENYPVSSEIIEKTPNYQLKFK